MDYICTECGAKFDYEDRKHVTETHGLDGPPYEEYDVCPFCGGVYEEAKFCKGCGEAHLEEELHEGYCFDCLKNSITYETALKYLESDDAELLLDMMCVQVYHCDTPAHYESELIGFVKDRYNRIAAESKMFAKPAEQQEFLRLVREYILDVPSIDDYADWYDRYVNNKLYSQKDGKGFEK